MFSVQCEGFGSPSVLKIKKTDLPELKDNEVLFKIKATALNRADTLQRKGLYPAPPGASNILGLEASGYVMNSDGSYDVNQPMMCLLPGGGYAEYVSVNKNHLLPVPKNVSIEEAGGLPEVWLTAYLNMKLANLNKNQNVMIYAGASGVGTTLIQLAKFYGLKSFVTCSTEEKINFCQKLGAELGFNYKKMTNTEILEHFNKNSILMDGIFDCVGQANFDLTSNLFNFDCKWVIYGTMSGAQIDKFNITSLMKKRAALITTTLRNRSVDFKAKLIEEFSKEILPGFLENKFQVIVDKEIRISWDEKGEEQIQNAHKLMESNENIGKIILVFP